MISPEMLLAKVFRRCDRLRAFRREPSEHLGQRDSAPQDLDHVIAALRAIGTEAGRAPAADGAAGTALKGKPGSSRVSVLVSVVRNYKSSSL